MSRHRATMRRATVPTKVLVYPELASYGVRHSRRQVDRLEADPDLIPPFPKRVPLGTNRVGWLETEIVKYVDALINSRSTAAGTLGSAAPSSKPPRMKG